MPRRWRACTPSTLSPTATSSQGISCTTGADGCSPTSASSTCPMGLSWTATSSPGRPAAFPGARGVGLHRAGLCPGGRLVAAPRRYGYWPVTSVGHHLAHIGRTSWPTRLDAYVQHHRDGDLDRVLAAATTFDPRARVSMTAFAEELRSMAREVPPPPPDRLDLSELQGTSTPAPRTRVIREGHR